jgi:endonuclease/exonuclease/phosphatase family metal-dependent hydrolase
MRFIMSIKVMSFNLRFENSGDGINMFCKRLWRVLDVIKSESPDIIGFQEVTEGMRAQVRRELKGYTLLGCGRDRNYHGESMLIAFKPEIFELIEFRNVWLSETPNVPGSRYYGDHSGCPRMYACALLKHNDIEKPFRFINTHLDHVGENGRLLESKQLINDISKFNEHFILTGDFNATPNAPEIENITSHLKDRVVIDCTKNLGPTFHAFGALSEEEMIKIDYIFTDGKCQEAYKVEDIPVNGQYYSDHNAVCAIIEL